MDSAPDLVDGYYQLLMRVSDIPLAAVSTPSVMRWEWLVMPQELYNALATFNRLATQVFRPYRDYARTLMTFLSMFVPKKVGQMLRIIAVICEPCSSTRALINRTPTRLNVFLVQGIFLF